MQLDLTTKELEKSPPFESSNIISPILYDEPTKTLVVYFRKGGNYAYTGVPREVFETLVGVIEAGESVGKAFHLHVKSGGFEYTRFDLEEKAKPEVRVPTYSGIEVGMQWYDNTPDWPLEKKVLRAVRYYQNKFNIMPQHQLEVLVSEADFPKDVLPETDYTLEYSVTPVMIVLDKYQRKNYMLVGLSHV